MNVIRKSSVARALALGLAVCSTPAMSNIWIFEPSIALDQRFDDNYFLLPELDGTLSATRAVGDLGLSRQSEVASIRGRARLDALVTNENTVGDESLDFNGLLAFDVKMRTQRSRYGVTFSVKVDTPSRDIAADISDESSLASDTGLNITQSLSGNVARTELLVKPNFQFDITRRLAFDTNVAFSVVQHELPSAQDAIYERYLELRRNGVITGPLVPYDQINIDDLGAPVGENAFTPESELDDFVETKIEAGFRYKLTPVTTLTATAGVSRFVADVVAQAGEGTSIPFEALIADEEVNGIRRNPRLESIATTNTFKLGYERILQPNLQLALIGGVYANTTDNTGTIWPTDPPSADTSTQKSETDGWLASVGLSFNSGTTRYSGKFAVDVQPSSSGAQVETNEITGELFRILSPRSNFTFKARAFEPDRLGARATDRFARRFISFEPKLEWRFTRNWTLTTAFRYRRQKAQVDQSSAQSNAVLLSVKYTPPSEIRDAARANGL